jgi:hypothetical protein
MSVLPLPIIPTPSSSRNGTSNGRYRHGLRELDMSPRLHAQPSPLKPNKLELSPASLHHNNTSTNHRHKSSGNTNGSGVRLPSLSAILNGIATTPVRVRAATVAGAAGLPYKSDVSKVYHDGSKYEGYVSTPPLPFQLKDIRTLAYVCWRCDR